MEEDGEQVADSEVFADCLQVLHFSQGASKTHGLMQLRQV